MPGDIVQRVLSGPNRGRFTPVGFLKDRRKDSKRGPTINISRSVRSSAQVSSGKVRVPAGGNASVEFEFTRSDGVQFLHGASIQHVHFVESGKADKRALFRNVARKNPDWNHARWIIVLRAWRVTDALFLRSTSRSKRVKLSGPASALRDGLYGVVHIEASSGASSFFEGEHTVAFTGARVGRNGRILSVL